MSTPDTDPDPRDGAPSSRLVWWMRALAGALALASLLSLWFSERARVRDDLQLSAEAAARPGETLALRAFYLQDVEAPAGPSLASSLTQLRLLDAHGRELARTELVAARGDRSMEGSLRLPETVTGGMLLEARTQLHDRAPLTCRRSLVVSESAPTLVPRSREAPPLQQQALGALRTPAPSDLVLLPRVVGGACVPEQRCTLLVWVGGEGAVVTLRHDAAVVLERIEPATSTAGFVEIVLRVFGPEASVGLEAHRAGQLAGERSLRLPVALGEAQLSLPRSSFVAGESVPVSVQLPPGRNSGIVDVFEAGRWRTTRAFLARAPIALRLSPEQLGRGIVRLQAHTDRFSGEGAGARVVLVREPGQPLQAALQEVAGALRASGFEPLPWDPVHRTLPAEADAERAATFMLAALEGLRLPLPRAVSARPFELRRLSRAQTGLRYGVGLLLVLCSLVVSLTLMRRGLRAQSEADAILEDASEQAGWSADERSIDEAQEVGNKAHPPGVYLVVCLVLAVGLAFLLAALLIVAKPLWF